jgi:putative transposase
VIAHAVRLRLRFALRYRDVEELLAKRGIVVSYETIRAWVATFGAQHPDTDAAERLRRRLLTAAEGGAPARLTTDTLGSYAAAKARLPELADAEHPQLRSATRCNDRVGQAHQPTPVRERGLRIRPVADPA